MAPCCCSTSATSTPAKSGYLDRMRRDEDIDEVAAEAFTVVEGEENGI
jgi:hypothetical protein